MDIRDRRASQVRGAFQDEHGRQSLPRRADRANVGAGRGAAAARGGETRRRRGASRSAADARPDAGGNEVDGADISYYGTIKPFHVGENCVVATHLRACGLEAWYERMEGAMPLVK